MDDLRDLLHNAAEEMRVSPEIPAKTLRRAKRRRLTNATIAGALTVAVIGAGFLGTRLLISGPDIIRPAGESLDLTALEGHMWPHTTIAEAQAAQTCVDDGHEGCAWLLDPFAVVQRYGFEELRWMDVYLDGEIPPDASGALTLRIGDCIGVGGSKELVVPIACEQEARVTLVQPVLVGSSGVWLVDVRATTVSQSAPGYEVPPIPSELVAFERALMQARLNGNGAEDFMSPKAMDAFNSAETGLSLYEKLREQPQHAIVGFAPGDRPGEFEVGVMMDTDPQTFEGWSVGPGRNVNGEERPMVLRTVFRGTLEEVSPQAAAADGQHRAVIQVLNGTNENGVAGKVAKELEADGYVIAQTGNASKVYERTTLFYRSDSRAVAQGIAEDHFAGALITPTENNLNPDIQVTIVIGLLNTPIEGDPRVHGQRSIEDFLAARSEGRGAEEFLTPDVAGDFDRGRDGLWLYPPDDLRMYGYGVIETKPTSEGRLKFIVHVLGSGRGEQRDCRFEFQERITAGPGKNQFGESRDWVIMSVSRSPVSGTSGTCQ